jgi:hypothetical protein
MNGGYVSKIDLYFTRQLTVQESIKVVCALALLFGVEYEMVSTVEGYYCSDLLTGRLLQGSLSGRLLQESTVTSKHQLQQQYHY